MPSRIHQFRRKAEECEALALETHDPGVRGQYQDLALQWMELAVQVQELLAGTVPIQPPRERPLNGPLTSLPLKRSA